MQRKSTIKALLGDFTLEDNHLYGVNRTTFEIYVGGEIDAVREARRFKKDEPGVDHVMANRFEKNLRILSSIDPKRQITVIQATCGGYWEEGMQMFSALLTCPNPTLVIAAKWARSMSSIIPLAADKFLIRPPARFMIHRGTYEFFGTEQEADVSEKERQIAHRTMMRIYTTRLKEQGNSKKLPVAVIRKNIEAEIAKKIDVWMSAQEAVERGYVDGLFTGQEVSVKKNLERRRRLLNVL